MESQEESKNKFIALMKNLISHIHEDQSHQQTIYQCLNLSEISRLFESLHDNSIVLRKTAAKFICQLVNGNQKIVQSLLLRQGCEVHSSMPSCPEPFIITGLKHYNMKPPQLLNMLKLLKRLKYRKNTLCWGINVKTMSVFYVDVESQEFEIDPNKNIIGVFKEEGTLGKRYSLRNIKQKQHIGSEQAKKKYQIAKYGSYKYK